MTMTDLWSQAGTRVVVTGAAKGIGYGIAHRFLEAGARVLLVDVDDEALGHAASRLSAYAATLQTCRADIAEGSAPARVVRAANEQIGGVDVLVNNAGIFPMVPMMRMESDLWDRIHAVNLRALAFLSQAAARRMHEQGRGGSIINIGSVDSLHPSRVGLAAYDASKGGVWMFTKSFALEAAPIGVRVNAILPGAIDTEGTQVPLEGSGMTAAQMRAMLAETVEEKIPLRRMGTPDDIAWMALYLASPMASYLCGAGIVVDGGMLLT